ncbi:hypothetical protein M9Y10_008880 [Tritrichomonas musculus]|uniref:Protein kinase domain-containing protein n=1 Tax=Tritrichomonas musculus TaxID=1915356 RepID=A0ABR2J177_9EUKA
MNYDEYIIELDAYVTQKVLKEKDKHGFGQVEIVQKKHVYQSTDDPSEIPEDDVLDPELYIRFPLSLDQRSFISEVELFVHTECHPAIVHFEGFIFLPKRLAVTEFYPNGSLQKMFNEISEGIDHPEWDGTMKSKCVFGIASALTHLHNLFPGYSMKYLCPENIMFDSQNEPKLINYVYGKGDFPRSNAYIPPEIHADPKDVHRDEDVWAFGMILYEIITGHKPYDGDSEDEIKEKILGGILPELPPPSDETNNIVGIIQNCLEFNRLNRPLFYMILDHLSNLSAELFPGTDTTSYNIYRNFIKQKTVQNDKSMAYMQRSSKTGNHDILAITKDAKNGDPFSITSLGRMIQKGTNGYTKNEKEGYEYFMRAAQMDYPAALYNASICLRDGRGVKQDKAKAFSLMEKAAKLGDPLSFNEYGLMIQNGIGTKRDLNKAKEIFQEGANRKYGLCQLNLADILIDEGPENYDKALHLYQLSTMNSCEQALRHHSYFYLDPVGERKKYYDPEKGLSLLRRAASKNDGQALDDLGNAYFSGLHGIEKDFDQAARLFRRSKNKNCISGTLHYAHCCRQGHGVVKDLSLARSLYQYCTKYNSREALFFYARMLYNGEGGDKDIKTAANYFKSASDQGIKNAFYFYGKICILGEGGYKNISQGKAYMKKYLDLTKKNPGARFPDAEEIYNKEV